MSENRLITCNICGDSVVDVGIKAQDWVHLQFTVRATAHDPRFPESVDICKGCLERNCPKWIGILIHMFHAGTRKETGRIDVLARLFDEDQDEPAESNGMYRI